MFLAVHATVGALIGVAIPSAPISFTLGFIGHFLTDMIPHGDEHIYDGYQSGAKKKRAVAYVSTDVVMTFLLIGLFFSKRNFFDPQAVAWGIVGSLLPDFIAGLAIVTKSERRKNVIAKYFAKFQRFHIKIHHSLIKKVRKFERDIPFKYGLVFQFLTLTLLVKAIL